MALVLKDRVKETTATTGAGTLTLAGAVAGFQSFAAIGNTNTTYYAIADATTGAWEVGLGTYTASGTTLSRDTILASSTGSILTLTSGNKDVFCTYPSEKSVNQDAAGIVTLPSGSTLVAPVLGTPASGNFSTGTFTWPTFNQDTTGKSAKTDALNSATTVVNVSSATAPAAGQILTATSSTAATWQGINGGTF